MASNNKRKVPHYWTADIRGAAHIAKTFEELSKVGLDLLKTLGDDVILVSGPISTGGRGSIEENLNVFNEVVHRFIENGENVFDQTPFEDMIKRLRKELGDEEGTRTLEEFYRPIIESGHITEMRFLPGWQTSVGATWERKLAMENGIRIVDL
jgi:hypothetical protein